MVASPRWRPEPARSRASIWRERLGWVAALSLLLHISIVTLLFLTPAPPRSPADDFVPPSEVAVLFNGGSNRAPAAPNPSTEPSVGPPSAEKALTAPPAGSTPAPPLAAPAQPSLPAAPQAPSVAQATPPPPAALASPPPPVPPAAASPPPPAPLAMLPTPPIPPALIPPLAPPAATPVAPSPPTPPRPAPLPPRLATVRPTPRPAPPPRPREGTPREDAFPKPLNFAFGGSLFDSHGSTGHAPPHESLGPVAPGPVTSRSAFNSDISGDIGPDYRSLLHAWLERHKYYPPQAAENGEDGTASVRVIIQKDGSVRLVELEQRSGSTWLDMGAQAIFRGQRLPPFPSDAMGEEQEVTVTIHYILIRG